MLMMKSRHFVNATSSEFGEFGLDAVPPLSNGFALGHQVRDRPFGRFGEGCLIGGGDDTG